MASKNSFLYLFFILYSFLAQAQDSSTLSGTITDLETNETLIGATVYVNETASGTASNEYGFYSITLPKGKYTIRIDYIGYKSENLNVVIKDNQRLNIALPPDSEKLDDLIITQNTKKIAIRKPEMSVNQLNANEIKKMPVVLGESDILKSLLQLPGVTNAGEGASGFNVRGGSAGQNLILLDEATVFNSSHLFGFFSVFNSDAIKDLKLYKGGIPARYGGRASSVLEIHQKNGNSNNFQATGGIGLISSRLLVEGPIVKEKASFLVAGRSSYAHLFLKLTDNKSAAYFYDLNTKLSYKINDNNNLYLSGYFGRDVFKFDQMLNNRFGNTMINLRWNHIFNEQIFTNTSVIYSDYYYGLDLDLVGFKWDSGIKNFNLKYDFTHFASENIKLKYGLNAIYYNFNPGKVYPTKSDSPINSKELEQKNAFEPSLYLEAEQYLSEKISINYGLRYTSFYRLGAETINQYLYDQPVSYNPDLELYQEGQIIGTKKYTSGETIQDFHNFEPRLAVSFAFTPELSIKTSYNRMVQYVHLISNTSAPTPLDIWTPSGPYLQPEIVDQFALGYFKNFNEGKYSLETEVFYKKGKNKVDYIDGAELVANDAIETTLLNGKSRAYGAEFLIRKNSGKLTGWIAYTLSKSEQKTPGRNPIEKGINNGNWYRSTYDKLHDLSITASYELNDKWIFSSSLSIQSGRPITYPNAQYDYLGLRVPSFGDRNSNNLPAFHHLDISAIYNPNPSSTKRWKGEWVFGIYNLYNRKNAASISFRESEYIGQNESVKMSIFGIVPSVTYNFKF